MLPLERTTRHEQHPERATADADPTGGTDLTSAAGKLLLTMLAGPSGLLLYLLLRWAKTRRWGVEEGGAPGQKRRR